MDPDHIDYDELQETLWQSDDEDVLQSVQDDNYFIINSPERIEWYAKKVKGWKNEIEVVKENARAIVETNNNKLKAFKGFFDGQVFEYLMDKFTKSGGKDKSEKTLYGRVSLYDIKPVVKIKDSERLIQYCMAHRPEFIEYVETARLTDEAVAHFTELLPDPATGELKPAVGAPGTEFVPQHTDIRVVTPAKAKPSIYGDD